VKGYARYRHLLFLFLGALWLAIGCSWPASRAQGQTLDVTLHVSTDIASWFLYHPEDLKHRVDGPMDWFFYDFASRREFSEGNWVGVETGAEGSYTVRFTSAGLTEREKRYVVGTQTFRLNVRHGRVYLDGGGSLPGSDPKLLEDPNKYPKNWLTLSNGKYRVIVYGLAWYKDPVADKDPDSAVPSYVVVLKQVASFADVQFPEKFPDLRIEDPTPEPQTHSPPVRKSQRTCLVLQWPQIIFPKISLERSLSAEQYKYLTTRYDFNYVFTPDLRVPAVATLVDISSTGSEGTGNGTQMKYNMSLMGRQLVRVVAIHRKGNAIFADVEPYSPSPGANSSTETRALKELFKRYARVDPQYRHNVEYPSFYAERIVAEEDAQQLNWFIAYALKLSPEQQRSILAAGQQEQRQVLLRILRERLRSFEKLP
jgi:hypothetical protein